MKIRVFQYGLGSENYRTNLYNPGSRGASIYRQKFKTAAGVKSEMVEIKKASVELCQVLTNNNCFIKINCEGSEIEILNDLLNHNLLNSKHSILVDFDIKKVDSDFLPKINSTLIRLTRSGVRYHDSYYFNGKWTEINVARWLNFYLPSKDKKISTTELIRYKTHSHLETKLRFYRIILDLFGVPLRRKITKLFYKFYRFIVP